MEQTLLFEDPPYPEWLLELIDNDSVLEDWEPFDEWQDFPEDHVLYCWQPDGTMLKIYEGSKIGLATYNCPGKSPIKYVKLIED